MRRLFTLLFLLWAPLAYADLNLVCVADQFLMEDPDLDEQGKPIDIPRPKESTRFHDIQERLVTFEPASGNTHRFQTVFRFKNRPDMDFKMTIDETVHRGRIKYKSKMTLIHNGQIVATGTDRLKLKLKDKQQFSVRCEVYDKTMTFAPPEPPSNERELLRRKKIGLGLTQEYARYEIDKETAKGLFSERVGMILLDQLLQTEGPGAQHLRELIQGLAKKGIYILKMHSVYEGLYTSITGQAFARTANLEEIALLMRLAGKSQFQAPDKRDDTGHAHLEVLVRLRRDPKSRLIQNVEVREIQVAWPPDGLGGNANTSGGPLNDKN